MEKQLKIGLPKADNLPGKGVTRRFVLKEWITRQLDTPAGD